MNLKDPDLLRMRAYVNGRWVHAAGGATHEVLNPASGRSIGTVPNLGISETRDAIEAAAAAFPSSARQSAQERAIVLRR